MEGLTKIKFVCLFVCLSVCLFVCLSVTGSKEHYRPGHELRGVLMLSGVIRCGELESDVRLPRMRMIARQPMHPKFIERGFSEVFESSELECMLRLSGSSLVDRHGMKIEFAGNKLFRDISMRET